MSNIDLGYDFIQLKIKLIKVKSFFCFAIAKSSNELNQILVSVV